MPAGEGSVHLNERVEDSGQMLRFNACAGVADREKQSAGLLPLGVTAGADEYLSGRRKFDGIAQEVEQDLLQAIGIAPERGGGARFNFADQLQTFLVSQGRHQFGDSLHQIVQVEGGIIEIDGARFHF